ncbi:MAG TPA: DinB family protein [Terriglobales bacterium]|nr:DinB family protein [Terriglobales bacterium]
MSQIDRMLTHYDQVMHGSAWHGDPVWQILEHISAEAAAARPLPHTHTIWEIVMHMTFWEGVVIERLHGRRAGLIEEKNFPPMPAVSEENWSKTLDEFRASNDVFRHVLRKLDPAKLEELSAAGKRTYYDEVHGIIEHHVYHAGQIALLKKE